jgi:ATP-dependent RNA helicase DDX27
VPITDGQMRQADMELKKGQNIIEHEAEIYARPARTWFQTEKEKQNAKGQFESVSTSERSC